MDVSKTRGRVGARAGVGSICFLKYAVGLTLTLTLTLKHHSLKKDRPRPRPHLETMYKALIVAHLNYSSYVWGFIGKGLSEKLQQVQNKAVRISDFIRL